MPANCDQVNEENDESATKPLARPTKEEFESTTEYGQASDDSSSFSSNRHEEDMKGGKRKRLIASKTTALIAKKLENLAKEYEPEIGDRVYAAWTPSEWFWGNISGYERCKKSCQVFYSVSGSYSSINLQKNFLIGFFTIPRFILRTAIV
jgi:hypothetical protein